MTDLELLQDSAFLWDLDKSEREALIYASKIRTLANGEILYYENEPIDKIYFLIRGYMKAYKVTRFGDEVFLFRQDSPGLLTLFSVYPSAQNRYFSNVQSIGESIVAAVDYKTLVEMWRRSSGLKDFLHKHLSDRFELLKDTIYRDLVLDGTAKVARMIATQQGEFNALKNKEIAYRLNIKPETLSRILAKLKREDIIDYTTEGVMVKNYKKLLAFYE